MATVSASPKIDAHPEFKDILREEITYSEASRANVSAKVNSAFDRLMLQSGLEVSPPMMLAICACSAITLGGLAFVLQESPLTTAIGLAIGAVAPLLLAMWLRSRRIKQMMKQVPDALDELARAARTGRSLEDCLQLVGRETADPLGGELRRCTRKLSLGLSVESAVQELPVRTGLTSLNVLVCALAVHQETGGDLVQMLERVARTTRDRLSFLGRLRAATIGSRATTVLMLVLPPAAMAFFLFRDPTYLDQLLSSFWGRLITISAVVLQVIGIIWVLRILSTTERA